MIVVYDPSNGAIATVLGAPASQLLQATPAGMAALVTSDPTVSDTTHYVDTATLAIVEYSASAKAAIRSRPEGAWEWSPAAGAWVDNRAIAEVRTDLLVRLRDKRDALLFGGLTWDGSVFDSDAEVSQPRLLGAFTTVIAGGWPAEGVAWRLKDNTWRVLSAADVQNLWAAFQTRMLSLFGAFAAHEAAVNAETDISVLRNYDTEAGWP